MQCNLSQFMSRVVVLLQFLIVNERVRDEDAEDDDPDPGVSETWTFAKDHWNLDKPSLIICIVYDLENSFMNRRLLKSILADLVKAAAEVEGNQSRSVACRFINMSI